MTEAETIKRLKLLSKAQTALLKALLQEKFNGCTKIVEKAIEKADSKTASELKKDLAALKLKDVEVDVNSTKLMMQEELKTLRDSINNNTATVKSEAPASSGSGIDSEEAKKLKSQVKALTDEVAKLKLEQSSVDSSVQKEHEASKSKDNTITSLKAEIDKGKLELTKMKKEPEEAQNAVKDSNKKLETEKEEIMEVMAQEVEDIEKEKNEEISKLEGKVINLQKVSDQLRKGSSAIHNGLGTIQEKASRSNETVRTLKLETKRDMDEMKLQLKNMYASGILNQCKVFMDEMAIVREKYKKEMSERRRLHNLVQELKGNIRVFMRCRPPTDKERAQLGENALCVSFPSQGEVKVYDEKNKEKMWEFDEVFQPSSTQEEVYTEVSSLVISVLDGYNVCIFAYGQTGSGKTWTMNGPEDNRGVNTRALHELFKRSEERSDEFHSEIKVSLLEVYNENIRDLLADSNDLKLEVKMSEKGNYVPGLTVVPVDEIGQVFQLLKKADKNRSSTATNMNEHSSRSHMMLQVIITSEHKETGNVMIGKLNLVDLAGSERIDKSGATGQALKEAQNINKSLSALGDVIAARAQKQGHVPFRNSTLTYLLQDSLSQDSKTLMIVCVSPVIYNAGETFCSLNFASRVRTVELGKASKQIVKGTGKGGKK